MYTVLQKGRLLNYVAPYKGLQGATAHSAATARNVRVNPFPFR